MPDADAFRALARSVSAVLGSSPWDPPPAAGDPMFRADGLVAVRPDGELFEDPMWQDYRWSPSWTRPSWPTGAAGGPARLPEADHPSAELVRLDVGTGVCGWIEALDGTWAGDGHDLRVEAVDEPMADDLVPRGATSRSRLTVRVRRRSTSSGGVGTGAAEALTGGPLGVPAGTPLLADLRFRRTCVLLSEQTSGEEG